ncbi:MAG TPA: choice-of-anchor D domain-containing protein, partial [Ktedonobacterales bacterium]|nr:choice-of-anchor D domain-containing protein [Ktedonobacterales bacterium]
MTSQRRLSANSLASGIVQVGSRHRDRGLRLIVALLVVVATLATTLALLPQHRAAAAPLTTLNPIQIENQQPGSTGWQFDNYNKENNHEIEGYASLTSVNQGGQISFLVSLSATAQYKMDIYRMGYYPQGTNPDGSPCSPCGGRLMQSIGPLTGGKQPACPTTKSGVDFGLIECNWTPSYTLTVPTNWTTGNYVVKLTRLDDSLENYMTFVVRSDGVPADIVYSMDVTTWAAYNYWGGAGNNDVGYDLYGEDNDVTQGFISDNRAYEVSFDRPYMDGNSLDGAGNFFVWDYPMIRWMESQGYNITYVTDVDLETNPSLFSGRKVFVNTGHDEYYSDNMRANLQNALNAGVNLAFFSANNIGNRILWYPSSTGQPDRKIYCDKGQFPNSTTVAWRGLTPPQPENALIGVMSNGVASGRPFLVADASSWIYAGTGLVNYNGTVKTSPPGQNAIQGLIGYEFDTRADDDRSLSDFVSFQPPGLHTVGHSFVPASDNSVNAWSDSTLYTAASGAMVFAAGTIQWSWGVDNGFNDGFCDCNLGYANTDSQIITANVLNRFVGGPAPAVSLSPTSLNLGSVTVGTTSSAQSATLTNSGTAALTINSITITGTNAGDFAQTNTCPLSPATLPASGTCTISVTFTPGVAGTRNASVSIADNASGAPHALPLTGIGLGPVASLSPGSVSFGNETVGYTSAAQTVKLTNSGTADLHISSIGLGGANAGDFAQTNTCPLAPSALAAQASCTISVTFAPTITGARSASVLIADDAPGSPRSVALSGTGTTPAPAVTLSNSSLSFGTVVIGHSSAAQSVTLTNSGTAALTINSIAPGGTNPGDFAQTNTCPIGPATLAPGGTCTISVTFTPSATGSRTASVSIADNAANSPQAIALSGTGQNPTAPAVTLSPTSLSFGNVNVGSTSPAKSITLTNSGNAALSISGITITGANSASFAQTN